MVYVYHSTPYNEIQYHLFSYDVQRKILEQAIVNEKGDTLEYSEIDVLSNGLREQKRIFYDSIDAIWQGREVRLHYGQLFCYELQDSSETLLYKFDLPEHNSENEITFVKNRYCKNCAKHDGDTLRLEVLGEVDDKNNGVITMRFRGYELYGKGKGLLKSVQNYENGPGSGIQLKEILSMSEWEKRMMK